MDMSEVKAFNAELSALYDNKPPISKAKMSAITRGAIKAIKFYKHVVHSVEKFIQKCKPEYKVPGLYVIDSIVRQSRHQFGQDKDVFAPRFAKNMQQTFANLFRCPPEDKRNIIRVLNLWQKNNVFSPQVIQPLLDMADPNHPLHQEIQQQQNNTANGSSLNISHNTSDSKLSPMAPPLHTPPSTTPLGDQFQDQSSNPPTKFNRKLLNDFEYESEDDAPPEHSSHTSHTSHTHSTQPQNPADALGSILTNPEIMRQLQSLQAQMQMMTGMQIPNLMPMMSDLQMPQNQNQGLPFMSSQQESQKQGEQKDDMVESDIEFVETGPQVIEIPDANDSSPSPLVRRARSRSPRRRRRSRSRSPRSPRRRRDRDRDREKDRDRDKDREKSHKEREADREKQKEREKKGLPPIKKENLSVCSTTLWVGHLSKLATPEELSDLFGGLGGVAAIDVVAPRGCAFVVMERRRDAAKAIAKLNKHKLHSKEITVAWAPGKGVKGREWKDYWEAELGVSYLPWAALHARWTHAALSLDALEDGGAVDEDTLPPWLPPRILPKTMMDNMSLLGLPAGGMLVPPLPALPGLALPAAQPALALNVQRMPPPGMPAGMPPNMAAGMPPGMRPGLPGVPGPLIRFPPGMPPQSMGQPGMGFLGGLLGVGGLVGAHAALPSALQGAHAALPSALQGALQAGVPLLHAVHQTDSHTQQQVGREAHHSDDAMELDNEDSRAGDSVPEAADTLPPALLPEQIQALLSKPPPNFNASEPPPNFNINEPPPFPQTEDKDDDRKDRDRDRRDRDRNRPERRDRDRNERDRDRNERDRRDGDRRDRDRRDGRDRDRDSRDERRDRDRDRGRDRRDRDRDRDRDRERFPNRDNNNRERSGSPRAEKTLQERLWEMANGKAPPLDAPPQDNNERPWSGAPPRPQGAAPFRAELRMRGPPRQPMPGAWMDGPGPGTFGPRFNGLGPPPFPRPPFEGPRAQFDGAMFERPPFPRMPFDGMNRPPFDGPRPPFDGMRPPFDGPRPPFDGPRPPFDGPRAQFDGHRPPFDGPRPPFDGPRSFDGPRPPFDGPRPPFDGRRNHEENRPPFDGPPRFDGPPDFFDQRQRRFDDREQFGDRGWNENREQWPDRRNDWDDRRRDRRQRDDDRFRDRGDRRRPYDDRNKMDDNNSRDDRSVPKDDRSKDDRIAKDETNAPNVDESVPKEDENVPKEEKPRREERRDRKSRWGAAEEPTENLIDQSSTDNISNIEQINTENIPNNEQATIEHVEVPSESVTMDVPSAVESSLEPSIAEPVQESQMEYEMETSHEENKVESHETALENQNDNRESSLYSPVQENSSIAIEAPAMDLYDAGEAVDTSFSEAPKASPPHIEHIAAEQEKPEIDNDMFSEDKATPSDAQPAEQSMEAAEDA